jgi:protein arginine kinase
MREDLPERYRQSDGWLDEKGPDQHVVVSSRARLARNLSRIPFATHAKQQELDEVSQIVNRTIQNLPTISVFHLIDLHNVSALERRYLKESHIISAEMEKGDVHRVVHVRPDYRISIMVNEEDHLRIQGLVSGFRLPDVFQDILNIDMELMETLPTAFSDQYGYLTACPTNLGTGLRVSVMLHLPGLTLSRKIEDMVQMVQPSGVTVRGFYGENSEYFGDFYQISNEISLGKTEEEIVDLLMSVIRIIIEQEEKARETLFHDRAAPIEDTIWRAYGLLSQARLMDTQEAMKLLSRIRLGVDRGYFKTLDHSRLSRLMIEIQPAHLEYHKKCDPDTEARDTSRAALLRNIFTMPGSTN